MMFSSVLLKRVFHCRIPFTKSQIMWQLNSFPTPKVLYLTTNDFFEKASNHLKEGDCAQACEKLFGVVEFSLRAYVNELSKIHAMEYVPLEDSWEYTRYWNLSLVVDKFLKEKGKKDFLFTDFVFAQGLHVQGWKMNRFDFGHVEAAIDKVGETVNKIQGLPQSREIVDRIYKELFIYDEIAAKIHKFVEMNKILEAVKLWRDRKGKEINAVAKAYKKLYKAELAQVLNGTELKQVCL